MQTERPRCRHGQAHTQTGPGIAHNNIHACKLSHAQPRANTVTACHDTTLPEPREPRALKQRLTCARPPVQDPWTTRAPLLPPPCHLFRASDSLHSPDSCDPSHPTSANLTPPEGSEYRGNTTKSSLTAPDSALHDLSPSCPHCLLPPLPRPPAPIPSSPSCPHSPLCC